MTHDTMTDAEPMTTAEALGSYYRELIHHGVPTDLAQDLLRDAGRSLHMDGLSIRRAEVAE